jgi:hypothetical protein
MEYRINGYWLGISIISLIDYTWLVFGSSTYENIIATITGAIVIISLGLAIKCTPTKPKMK